ncbi:MAG TPA: LLM class F420-dependent oxidoreductase [Acidimicrobiales bacterium]|nr:LLM class F420-dependent oxidoreductase [Acidimicrobiales bacterium]
MTPVIVSRHSRPVLVERTRVDRPSSMMVGMRLRIFVEPQQGASYDDQLSVALCAEEEGFEAFFRSDHYLKMGKAGGLPGPTDAWATLAGLARETTSIRLGTLVTSATFRLPGPLAITVAQVDAMSGGRVELGLGAGWYEDEHRAYGIPFPPLKERFDRLEEQLAVITGLWETAVGETFDFEGRFFTVTDSPTLPKPVQRPRPPIIVGGGGPRRTPMLAARFADEYNAPFLPPDDVARQYARVDEACERIGRDPASIRRTAALIVCCAEDDSALARRAESIGWSLDDLRRFGACGSPAEVAGRLHQWGEAGTTTAYLQILDMGDLDHVRLIGREVAPLLP